MCHFFANEKTGIADLQKKKVQFWSVIHNLHPYINQECPVQTTCLNRTEQQHAALTNQNNINLLHLKQDFAETDSL